MTPIVCVCVVQIDEHKRDCVSQQPQHIVTCQAGVGSSAQYLLHFVIFCVTYRKYNSTRWVPQRNNARVERVECDKTGDIYYDIE